MTGHYFDADPSAPDERSEITVRVAGVERTYLTSGGVFSHGGIDKATAILLKGPIALAGSPQVLDLGCGWGVIACTLAAENPSAHVWAVDVNQRALELTRANAERLDLRVSAALPEELPDDVQFDAIWSNPPIRIGKEALHELLLLWLPRLAPGGEARLVVGKNLGADSLQRWLSDQGWDARRESSEQGFRVLVVRRVPA